MFGSEKKDGIDEQEGDPTEEAPEGVKASGDEDASKEVPEDNIEIKKGGWTNSAPMV